MELDEVGQHLFGAAGKGSLRTRKGLGRVGQRAKDKWILPQVWTVTDAQDEKREKDQGRCCPLEHSPPNWPPLILQPKDSFPPGSHPHV